MRSRSVLLRSAISSAVRSLVWVSCATRSSRSAGVMPPPSCTVFRRAPEVSPL